MNKISIKQKIHIWLRCENKYDFGELNISEDDKILVVSPHPDDESIGCGGFLLKYSNQCDVIILNDGGTGNPEMLYEDTVRIRESESINSMHFAGIRNLYCMKLPQRELTYRNVKNKIGDLSCYDYIMVPHKYESHEDHKKTNKIIKKLFRKERLKAKILCYEVWTPLRRVDSYIKIDGVVEKKRKLVSIYESQMRHWDYAELALSLNRFRGGSQCLRDSKYIEAFEINYGFGDAIKIRIAKGIESILSMIRRK